jgi:hypothetical protein
MKIENQEVHEPSQVKSYCPVVHRARKPKSASPLRGLVVGASEHEKCSSSKKFRVVTFDPTELTSAGHYLVLSKRQVAEPGGSLNHNHPVLSSRTVDPVLSSLTWAVG